eukprot:13064787-Ditylum_brightwellii.AAC.1
MKTNKSSSPSHFLLCLALGVATTSTVTHAFLAPSPFDRYITPSQLNINEVGVGSSKPTKGKWMSLGGKAKEEDEAFIQRQWKQQKILAKKNSIGEFKDAESEQVDSKSRRQLLLLSLLSAVTTTTATTAAVASASMNPVIQNDLSSSSVSIAAVAAAAAASTTILKSPLDQRKYETFVLDNDLR